MHVRKTSGNRQKTSHPADDFGPGLDAFFEFRLVVLSNDKWDRFAVVLDEAAFDVKCHRFIAGDDLGNATHDETHGGLKRILGWWAATVDGHMVPGSEAQGELEFGESGVGGAIQIRDIDFGEFDRRDGETQIRVIEADGVGLFGFDETTERTGDAHVIIDISFWHQASGR